jgi:hypothetical protein
MDPSTFAMNTITAIASAFAQKGVDVTFDKAKEIIEKFSKKEPSLFKKLDIDELANKIQTASDRDGQTVYSAETLARYLEIPVPDLKTLNPETIELDVLYNHVKLESEFQEWLKEWGYDTESGCPLIGLRGVEYIPDVYGKLDTLHGQFEICINFVCDVPPNEDRVLALLAKIEAYAEAKKSFAHGDIFALVTPSHEFTQGAISAICLQNEQESYSVFCLDGGNIHALEQARSPKERLEELHDEVREAEVEARRSRIKKTSREQDEEM